MGRAAPGRPVVGVLAVQGAFVEHERALRAAGAEPRQVRVPAQLEGLHGLVIPGGESTTFGLVAERSGLLDALRRLMAEGPPPILATCAGMIMLAADTTGGPQPLVGGLDITVRRNAFGRQAASFEAPVEMARIPGPPLPGVFIRAPWIERAGPGVEVLARHGGHAVAARQGEVMVTAFHPELTDDGRLHAWLVDRARERRRHDDEGSSIGGARVRAQ